MIHNSNHQKSASELRFDLVSKDWVVIVTGRTQRPDDFVKPKRARQKVNKEKDCPFCHLETQEPPVLEYRDEEGNWEVAVVPNKFPAFFQAESLHERAHGPYSAMDGVGFHEVVITSDHEKSLAQMPLAKVRRVIDAYQERYLALAEKKFVSYISIFHNYGSEAGASIIHPHSQLIAIPLIDPDLRRSLNGSRLFFENQGECVHCQMLQWDLEEKRRIVFENKKFVVLVPFASRVAFETRIYPRQHQPYFERIGDQEKQLLAEALQMALSKLFRGLNDPAYNFFIHTAPCDGKDHEHYHWHFEILPKTSTWAGFELGAGIEISTVEPEQAAEYLRNIK